MKNMKLYSSLLLSALCAATAACADIPLNDLSKFNIQNLSAANDGGKLTLRENGPGRYGTIKTRVAVKKAKYLQIIAGASENPDHFLTLSNVSFRSNPAGAIFQGVNTFVLPEKNFTMCLTLTGPRGTTPGGWYVVEGMRTVNNPTGGVVIESPKPVVEVNSKFTVKYFAESKLAADPEVKAFMNKSMSPVNFGTKIVLNDRGENGDEKANDNIYSAQVAVTSDASAITGKSGAVPGSELIFALTLPDGSSSFGTPGFAFNIKTANKIPNTITRLTPLAAQYRDQWYQATKGENLALGKPVDFSITPSFYLTATGGKKLPNRDRFDLTDGALSVRGNDILRFDYHAVGWRSKSSSGADIFNGVDMIVDLGKVQPVSKCVIRINCGDKNRNIQRSPRKLQVLVSKDNINYYPAGSPLLKLQPGEKDQSDFKKQFYLEETDQAIFCYPFELAVNSNARYVMLRVVPDGGNLYCDELAVIKAANPADATDEAYSKPGEKRLTDGLEIKPSEFGTFYIADNIPAPNYMMFNDLRTKKGKYEVNLVMEMPAGIKCLNADVKTEKIKHNGLDYTRYTFTLPAKLEQWGKYFEGTPFFLQAEKGLKVKGKARFYALLNGKPSHIFEQNIQVITLPESDEWFRGYTVISRMGQPGEHAWPGYYENLKKLGFSAVQTYPYMMQRSGKDLFTEQYIANIEKARKCGYKIVVGYNGLLDMYKYSKHRAEAFCQIPDKKDNCCPSYRGQAYIDEMAKIRRAVALLKPDCIQWDIEHWGRALPNWKKCARCQAAFKKSGKSWDDFLDDLSVELNAELNATVAAGAKDGNAAMPLLYNYNRHSLHINYHGFEKWALNNKFVSGGQPSLYVAGNEIIVHNSIKNNFANQADKTQRTLIPLLTPGTYGAYEPYHLEQMIYEAMLNGSKGFFYYPWRGFVSPIYFYYHSKAMKNVIEHQKLIFEGEIYTPQVIGKDLIVSGVKNSSEALILIGNYHGMVNSCQVTLPFDNAEITDVQTKEKINPADLKNLPIQLKKIRLLHARRK